MRNGKGSIIIWSEERSEGNKIMTNNKTVHIVIDSDKEPDLYRAMKLVNMVIAKAKAGNKTCLNMVMEALDNN